MPRPVTNGVGFCNFEGEAAVTRVGEGCAPLASCSMAGCSPEGLQVSADGAEISGCMKSRRGAFVRSSSTWIMVNPLPASKTLFTVSVVPGSNKNSSSLWTDEKARMLTRLRAVTVLHQAQRESVCACLCACARARVCVCMRSYLGGRCRICISGRFKIQQRMEGCLCVGRAFPENAKTSIEHEMTFMCTYKSVRGPLLPKNCNRQMDGWMDGGMRG